ncbi:tripartite tricarboxylate transporter TctB family protein [Paucibacter sp. PLA-PC-4]|uniref:tripartite tricarboxylate transporter TctB family protein n=1 Tax=Paucibacter sp. PLA-PC-4 TaxID=2993655 RepID=UPI00224A8A46|nr:tripartite tricarboxylate transporter TctB family protein [Paucibacter sp. PLA-PC-4]MCX2865725.1 tripartite tricarboxylate transporter TctB family protein [Paucibacter sp. PLA-PC-4]
MKIKSQKDFWSGLMFLVVGIGFAWGATEYSFGSSARPGPGYFPFGLGILLAILGGAVLFKALTIESEGGDPIGGVAWKPLLIIVAAVVLFGVMLPRLGLAITLPVLIVFSAMAGDEFRWRGAVLSAVVLTAGSWFIFVWGLNLVLPVWPTIFGG